jgi:ABC-type uncharacterized transport system permease subunit
MAKYFQALFIIAASVIFTTFFNTSSYATYGGGHISQADIDLVTHHPIAILAVSMIIFAISRVSVVRQFWAEHQQLCNMALFVITVIVVVIFESMHPDPQSRSRW